jgi:hypothetical protein
VMLGVGSVGYALVRGDATELLVFPAGSALSPFVVGAVVVALLVVVAGVVAWRHQAQQGIDDQVHEHALGPDRPQADGPRHPRPQD